MLTIRPYHAVLLVAILLAAALPAVGQSKEATKQQVESQLKQMSPEEIDRRLKEAGLSYDEASRMAKDLGISLEDYLSLRASEEGGTTESPAVPVYDPRLGFQTSATRKSSRPDSLRAALRTGTGPKRLKVPGFHGRRGVDSLLQPFGYDLFQLPEAAFEPSVNVATPPSYSLGAGDELQITVWGETHLSLKLAVNRDGNVVVPDVGPVQAIGLTVQEFRDRLVKRMTRVYSGLRNGESGARSFLDVTLGRLKTIQVFVLGEVNRPGGYPLTSMSTAMQALFVAGGPTPDGSLRNLQVVRKGSDPLNADLYGFMLEGSSRRDVLLQDGDVVFVRPALRRVAVMGEVIRPAIYELRPEETLGDAIRMAGGLRFTAYVGRVHIERVVPFDKRGMYDKDLLDLDIWARSQEELVSSRTTLESGDVVTVFGVSSRVQNRVYVTGNVRKPGPFELRPGMRIRDLVIAADSLERSTFAERGTLYRMLPNLRYEVMGFNVAQALLGDEEQNVELRNEDSVVIYPERNFVRDHFVTITGAVRRPGKYLRDENMTAADLVLMAGGLVDGASTNGWEISRMDTTGESTYAKVLREDLGSNYWSTRGENRLRLVDYDVVRIPMDPRFAAQKLVHIDGYVMFPGAYALRYDGEKIADLFARAGGVKRGGYLEGSRLIRRFNNAGLVPIDFRTALNDLSSRDNVVLYEGDSIHVAQAEDVVYVSGEVYVPSPVLYKERASLSYYIEQAGDYKEEAESGKTVVFMPGGKKWEGGEILPGSSIFVPRKIDKPDNTLPVIANLVTILASLAAITVAVIQVTK
jgi:protein involved in polysaccharide export with SLBB domain